MNHPLVYEINVRCWLRELSEKLGAKITLGNVPDAEFEGWRRLGFTHVWLMGVWTTGAHSRACSRNLPGLRKLCRDLMPGFSVADVLGSPFAIAGYEVARALGGETGLKKFRRRLAQFGLKLILDFIPNHTGLDHPWLREKPELYVQSPKAARETFRLDTPAGPCWIAYGKDPYFPGWIDTAQLDYRNPATHTAVLDELRGVAALCDGVRCDMAMLMLNDVFARTWTRFPSPHTAPEAEFWATAISAIDETRPDFLFFAEAYWNLEARLQELGFDYTYDKRLYDYLVARNYPEAHRHLSAVSAAFLEHSGHFLENHDEQRITSLLSWPEHQAAALVTLGVPGLRLLHEGQITGATKRVSVHCGRRPVEAPNPKIAAWYERLLTALPTTLVGRGSGEVIHTERAWDRNPTCENFVVIQWQGDAPAFDLVVVNLAMHQSQCYAELTAKGLADHHWQMKNLLGDEVYERRGDDLDRQGLYLDLSAHGAQLFHFEPIP
ncbi:MAG: alpha-amylase [Verrucomicrobia bacterium]|nr:alpha-amylase [Verrucomicrobiota bacterium]